MNNVDQRVSGFVRTQILVAVICGSVTAPVVAQDAVTDDESIELRNIVVTGSRIKKTPDDVSASVTTIDARQIEARGFVNIRDALQDNPATQGGGFNASRSTEVAAAGVSTIDLRNLGTLRGASRTLVLVNGRRHVAGVAGTSDVNLGSIPASMVERIEIVTGGSSAVYGSEAVAGVVNIILKESYDAFNLHVQGGLSDKGDRDQFGIGATWGTDVGYGRGDFLIGVEYADTKPAFAFDREYLDSSELESLVTTIDATTFGTTTSVERDVRNGTLTPSGVPLAFGGLALLTDSTGTPVQFGPGGTLVPYDFGTPADPVGPLMRGFGFPLTNLTFGGQGVPIEPTVFDAARVSTASERFNLNSSFNWDLTDTLGFFAEAKASLIEGTAFGILPITRAVPVQAENPFLDPAAAVIIGANTIPGMPVTFNRRLDELGPEVGTNKSDSYRGVVGLRGSFGDDYEWEASFNYGRTESDRSQLRVSSTRVAQAADVTVDGGGNPVCRDPSNGCVPINLLGPGQTITNQQIAFIQANHAANTVIDQIVVEAHVTGSIVDTAAGAIDFAAGLEYRDESSDFSPNEALQAAVSSVRQRGSFDVVEAFGELNIPLFKDRPGVRSLTVDLSTRFGGHSEAGSLFTWKGGLTWVPVDAVQFRVSHGTANRAPNISELFRPVSTSFTVAPDTCSFQGLAFDPTGGNRSVNCMALGVPPTVAPFPGFDAILAANPDLTEEEATSTTVGISLTPTFFEGLQLAVDYWSIDIEDAISEPGFFDLLTLCYEADPSLTPTAACGAISRDAITGNLVSVTQRVENISMLKREGVDITLSYITPESAAWGQLILKSSATLLDTFEEGDPFGLGITDRKGMSTGIETVVVSSISYLKGPWTVFLQARYQDEFDDTTGILGSGTDIFAGDAVTYWDLSTQFLTYGGLKITVGSNNVFDEGPGTRNRTSMGSYDLIGRTVYARVAYEF